MLTGSGKIQSFATSGVTPSQGNSVIRIGSIYQASGIIAKYKNSDKKCKYVNSWIWFEQSKLILIN